MSSGLRVRNSRGTTDFSSRRATLRTLEGGNSALNELVLLFFLAGVEVVRTRGGGAGSSGSFGGRRVFDWTAWISAR